MFFFPSHWGWVGYRVSFTLACLRSLQAFPGIRCSHSTRLLRRWLWWNLQRWWRWQLDVRPLHLSVICTHLSCFFSPIAVFFLFVFLLRTTLSRQKISSAKVHHLDPVATHPADRKDSIHATNQCVLNTRQVLVCTFTALTFSILGLHYSLL